MARARLRFRRRAARKPARSSTEKTGRALPFEAQGKRAVPLRDVCGDDAQLRGLAWGRRGTQQADRNQEAAAFAAHYLEMRNVFRASRTGSF